jgi:inhibitor of the pro-sigma K processing machinery
MSYYIRVAIIAIIVILIAKFLFHAKGKELIGIIVNAIVGFIVIWLINYTGLISIPLNIVTSLVVGILGIPGVVILILLVLLGII